MADSWRLLLDPPQDGQRNMAVDMALLHSADEGFSPPTLRFYDWIEPTLSIGFSQQIGENFDADFIEQNRIPVVRRPTGGAAILHFDEVTYSLTLPASSPHFGSLKKIYSLMTGTIVLALSSIGFGVDREEKKNAGNRAACLLVKNGHELSVSGKKIVCAAQRRLKSAAMQHGSIMLNIDKRCYLSCFRWPSAKDRLEAESLIGGLNENGAATATKKTLQHAIIAAIEKLYDINIVQDELNDEEEKRVNSILEKDCENENKSRAYSVNDDLYGRLCERGQEF